MHAGDLNCFGNRQFLYSVGGTRHPGTGLLAPEDTVLESTSPGDAAEVSGELIVVLELKPVDKAVLSAQSVHRIEEFLAVELRQESGPNRLRKVR